MLLADTLLFPFNLSCQSENGFAVEADICDRGKKTFQHQFIALRGRSFCPDCPRKSDESADQLILTVGRVRFFSAYTRIAVTACIVSRLLALETKHFFHCCSP